MTNVGMLIASTWRGLRILRLAVAVIAGLLGIGLGAATTPAAAADPAVVFMAKVGRELMAAARSRSPSMMAGVIEKYGDITYIGLYSLGNYRAKLATADRPESITPAPFVSWPATPRARRRKYPIARVEWNNESVRGGSGVMVDSTITLRDGSTYEVRWLLAKVGGSYKVRDAMVYGFWMTPFLKKLFEDYVTENGGSVRALTTALNR